jgi:pimeloyl-ACP methyl ester carboxylesterase
MAVNGGEHAGMAEGRVTRFSAQDGLMLAARVFGMHQPHRLPILCLPGLSRNSRDFIALGRHFSENSSQPRQVFALDYRGRGRSDYDRDWRNYTPLSEAHDVMAAAAALGIAEAVLVGTSRGGLIAMILGALRPGLMAGIVLNDIGPVIEGTGLARIKRYLTGNGAVSSWEAAEQAIHHVNAAHFPALDDDDWEAFTRAIFVEADGKIRPDFDPKLVNTVKNIDFETSIPVLWPQFDSLGGIPVLSIRGENSDILSIGTVSEMAARHHHFEQLTVPGQGHAPLLRDAASLERITAFALRCDKAHS